MWEHRVGLLVLDCGNHPEEQPVDFQRKEGEHEGCLPLWAGVFQSCIDYIGDLLHLFLYTQDFHPLNPHTFGFLSLYLEADILE